MTEPIDLLRRLTGNPDAAFRDGQEEAIRRLVDDRGRALVVQRTGWGKSAVYFIATRLLRDAGAGPTVLISPLLALMRNQLTMAARAGVAAATINSSNTDEWDAIEERIQAGEIDLLLISPERLNNDQFRANVLPELTTSVGLLVVDEAHCISDWGHDFRPDYRRIRTVLADLPATIPVLCTTATANERVVDDIVDQLGAGIEVVRGPLGRESLSLSVVDLPDPAHRLAWLATVIPTLEGTGIVYCLTVRDAERVAAFLRSQRIEARAYSGDSDDDARRGIEEDLLANRLKVVVATSALGMGFDKPDLAFVIHFQSPGSPIAYYQQVGRAGRALDASHGVLLCGAEDADIQDWFIRTAFPKEADATKIVNLIDLSDGLSLPEIEREVNIARGRLEGMLKILQVDGAVVRERSRWRRSAEPWDYPIGRIEQVTAQRRMEQAAMVDYARTDGCRMAFIGRLLDDPDPADCGRCDNCRGEPWEVELEPALVGAALAHIRRASSVIEPRKQWPKNLDVVSGNIPVNLRAEEGRALASENDGGWGKVIKRCRADGTPLPDELIDALVDLVAAWAPTPAPTWVTAIPSRTSSIGTDAAFRLAQRLGLPYVDIIERTGGGPSQRDMANSAQQYLNVHNRFRITGPPPDGPVLLVDDLVDSRWTFTVVAAALREATSGLPHPLALTQSE